jgi:hypothetical protein
MSTTENQLEQDRALRRRAKASFDTSLAIVRGDIAPAELTRRAVRRAGEGTAGFAADTAAFTARNYGKIAGVMVLTALWFARRPIMNTLRQAAQRGCAAAKRMKPENKDGKA